MGVKKSSLYKMMKAGRGAFYPHRCPTPLSGGRPGQTDHEVLQEGPTFDSSPLKQHWQMALTKEEILRSTRNGYDVFSHYIGISLVAPNKAFRNPFYHDTRASCYVYADKETWYLQDQGFWRP
jgi:hypothetical protein